MNGSTAIFDAGLPGEPTGEDRATNTPESAEVNEVTCDVTPQQTEGPYYFDAGQVRRDITEGKPGIPLLVQLRLMETGPCEPIRDAAVDIWHVDAAGRYSGYERQGYDRTDTSGETFLRGTQFTDADGLVEFETIYPGGYRNRTVHIHFKAYTDELILVTSQIYFPDGVTDTVQSTQPYTERGPQRATNERDEIFMSTPANEALLGHVERNGDGYVVSLTIGVAR